MELSLFIMKEGLQLLIAYCIFKWMFKKEEVDYNPMFYVVIDFFFGFLTAVFLYLGRLNKDKNNEKGSKIFYGLTWVMVLINIIVIMTSLN